ncbi:hypothetical protein PG991_000158 [Apiospora marii]|uniref:F-box domain-containing protein n=1 Tax=Apiospora marii TaxID=335849 RepID=A0ABR1T326_9PEZI
MDRLPPEIAGEILQLACDASDEQERCSYATVSRDWQAFVERATFSNLYLNQQRLQEAQASGILTSDRQSYIRCIEFSALLPTLYYRPGSDTFPYDSRKVVLEAVDNLLAALNTWSFPPRGIELILSVRYTGSHAELYASQFRQHRWESLQSLIKLPHDVLPEVPCITKFTHHRDLAAPFRLTPGSCCAIANRFPNLKTIDWSFIYDHSEPSGASHSQWRYEFATGISLLPKSVRHASIYENGPLCRDEALDPLSLALREFTKQLESLTIWAIIGKEIFDDPGLNGDGERPLWPRLRKVALHTGDKTPQGHSLLEFSMPTANINEYTGQGGMRRQLSKQGEIYWITLARAAAHMPELQNMRASLNTDPMLTYSVEPNSSGADFQLLTSEKLDIRDVLQEAWWETAQVHIRDGAGFHFMVKEKGKTVNVVSSYDGEPFVEYRQVEPLKLVEWTRTKA